MSSNQKQILEMARSPGRSGLGCRGLTECLLVRLLGGFYIQHILWGSGVGKDFGVGTPILNWFFTLPLLAWALAGLVRGLHRRPRGLVHGLAGIDWRVCSCQDLDLATLDHHTDVHWTTPRTMADILTGRGLTTYHANLMPALSFWLNFWIRLSNLPPPCFIIITMNAIHVQVWNWSPDNRKLVHIAFVLVWSNIYLCLYLYFCYLCVFVFHVYIYVFVLYHISMHEFA